jgi:hypothetical protein
VRPSKLCQRIAKGHDPRKVETGQTESCQRVNRSKHARKHHAALSRPVEGFGDLDQIPSGEQPEEAPPAGDHVKQGAMDLVDDGTTRLLVKVNSCLRPRLASAQRKPPVLRESVAKPCTR